jgi:kynureninase
MNVGEARYFYKMNHSFEASLSFAQSLDSIDPIAGLADEFSFPKINGQKSIYFCGNSLGLQPKQAALEISEVMKAWSELGIEGFTTGKHPWMSYQNEISTLLMPIVGAEEAEVTAMNSLTINLHLLLQSFYQPTPSRYKILLEAGSFPSDRYAIVSMLNKAGIEPSEALIELAPREAETFIRTEDILQTIENEAAHLHLVLFSGVQYYSGQLFDMASITHAAKKVGATVGWDLAHAVGNVPLRLHDWGVDFAVWCHYKYLNSGPGAVGGAFVHRQHFDNECFEGLAGWWGNAKSTRFQMLPDFEPERGIDGWHVSTPNIIGLAAVKAGLSITDKVGLQALREKSLQLTGYLEFLLGQDALRDKLEILTPKDPTQRGAQLSVYFKEQAADIQKALRQAGVVTDYRRPGVIRVAPAPLYCTFEDVFRFYSVIQDLLA